MNPGSIIFLIFVLSISGGKPKASPPVLRFPHPPKSPSYIDTFKMELALDRLHSITNAIEKVNHLSQVQKIPEPKGKMPSIDRIQESLDAVKGFLADGKPSRQVNSLSDTLSGVKKLGNLDELAASMGPILSMLKNIDQK
ncbi:MAG TPA: hypothetical protein PLV37_08095 [Bacillota bacterium]|jgi:hypothetical protein|nr:hypothetical protein [Bacillota bacterium]